MGIGGSCYKIPKAIFYLLKEDYRFEGLQLMMYEFRAVSVEFLKTIVDGKP